MTAAARHWVGLGLPRSGREHDKVVRGWVGIGLRLDYSGKDVDVLTSVDANSSNLPSDPPHVGELLETTSTNVNKCQHVNSRPVWIRLGGRRAMTAAALLADLRRRGVELTASGTGLRYRAPAGVLTPELRAAIALYRHELLAILTGDPPAQVALSLEPRPGAKRRNRRRLRLCGAKRSLEKNSFWPQASPGAAPSEPHPTPPAAVQPCELGRAQWITDPRAEDLPDDSALWLALRQPLWARLFELAYDQDGEDPYGLYGALRALRCVGAQLARDGSRLKLAPGLMDPADYRAFAAQYLARHTAQLRALLAEVAAAEGTPSEPGPSLVSAASTWTR